jgi:hypothetical protein
MVAGLTEHAAAAVHLHVVFTISAVADEVWHAESLLGNEQPAM